MLGPENIWFLENLGFRKILVLKKFGVPKNLVSRKILDPEIFQILKKNPVQRNFGSTNVGCMHRAVCVEMFCTQSRHLPDTIYSLGCENWLGGGWVGGFHHDNRAIPWPNLQVRTCKIQAKLDSKLGPSVAINIQNQINQTKPYQTKPNQTKLSKAHWVVWYH